MPNEPRNHNFYRSKICLLCFEKGQSLRIISGITLERVSKYFLENVYFVPGSKPFLTQVLINYAHLYRASMHY